MVAVVLSALLAVGGAVHPGAPRTLAGSPALAPRAAYSRQVDLLLARSDASLAALDDALSQRDRNPALVLSDAWIQRYTRIVSELEGEYRAALALTPPAGAMDVQTCLSEGLRLTSTGARMLHDAFQTSGHGAYYLSAHGNWDLNLGVERLRHCQALLAPIAAPRAGE